MDYPQQDEILTPAGYTFRVAAENGGTVEVSVNAGPWLPCRQAAGYWWYDWSGYAPGRFRLVARRVDGDASEFSEARRFSVKPAGGAAKVPRKKRASSRLKAESLVLSADMP